MNELRDHILANLSVRAALVAGDSSAIARWYNAHQATVTVDGETKPATKVVSRRLNRDGILERLGLNLATSIIVLLRNVAATPHEKAPLITELLRLIDGGSGPDFGDTEIRLLINQLETAQVLTQAQATALRGLAVDPVTWSQQLLDRAITSEDVDETLRSVRQPGLVKLRADVLQVLTPQ